MSAACSKLWDQRRPFLLSSPPSFPGCPDLTPAASARLSFPPGTRTPSTLPALLPFLLWELDRVPMQGLRLYGAVRGPVASVSVLAPGWQGHSAGTVDSRTGAQALQVPGATARPGEGRADFLIVFSACLLCFRRSPLLALASPPH